MACPFVPDSASRVGTRYTLRMDSCCEVMTLAVVQERATCAYCGQPLHLVAGFCATCHAPVMRARLIAAPPRRPRLTMAPPRAPVRRLPLPEAIPARQDVIWNRVLLGIGLVALFGAVISIGSRLSLSPVRAWLLPPPQGALALTANGRAVSNVTAGQTLLLRYDVLVTNTSAIVTVTLVPPQGAPRTLAERWPIGDETRAQPLCLTLPGVWRIVLRRDGTVIQDLALDVLPAPSSQI